MTESGMFWFGEDVGEAWDKACGTGQGPLRLGGG
jgi:hypothetical protein